MLTGNHTVSMNPLSLRTDPVILLRLLCFVFRMTFRGRLGNGVFLVLLDLAAFDTVSYHSILRRLSNQIGVTCHALDGIQSYLAGRTQSVSVSGNFSKPAVLKYGVPQRSILGPGFSLITTRQQYPW